LILLIFVQGGWTPLIHAAHMGHENCIATILASIPEKLPEGVAVSGLTTVKKHLEQATKVTQRCGMLEFRCSAMKCSFQPAHRRLLE